MLSTPVFILLSAALLSCATADDLITNLPGLSFKPNFRSYSGYLKGATATKKLHYWFVESQKNPSTDPLVLWLNGGPGCSSVEGLLNEHGPYLVNEDGKTLRENAFSWNKIANVLYLEAPAGVGYSYADDKQYKISDDEVAKDNYAAIKDFLERYPQYNKREFFITGESYGGIYVPTLSVLVLEDNSINFQGAAVGNGALSFRYLDDSIVPFAYSHGLFGTDLMQSLYQDCCPEGPLRCNYYDNPNDDCNKDVMAVQQILGELNIYNLYDECYPAKASSRNTTKFSSLQNTFQPLMFTQNPYVQAHRQKLEKANMRVSYGGVPPCIDAAPITSYMNNPTVRKALHVPEDLPEWAVCSGIVGAQYERQYNNMTWQVNKILNAKKRVLVYNGDVDMACNFLGDEWFVESLARPVATKRTDWTYVAEDGTTQVAGFIKRFENIDFVTVRGSGHMVPQDKPRPAYDMFKNFINNQPY